MGEYRADSIFCHPFHFISLHFNAFAHTSTDAASLRASLSLFSSVKPPALEVWHEIFIPKSIQNHLGPV